MPDNNIEWGQGAVNNDIGWGKGASDNSISWGAITADSPSGDTNLVGGGGSSFTNTKSLFLDGVNDFVTFAQTNFATSGTVSYSFWARPNTYQGGYGYFFSDSTQSNGGIAMSEGATSGAYTPGVLYYYTGSTVVVLDVTLTENVWQHIVVVFNGSNIKTYKNGSLQTTKNYTTVKGTFNTIGRFAAANTHYINGKLDEIAVFDLELGAEQVASIYNSGTPNDVLSLSPSVWYRFESTAGGGPMAPITTADSSGNNKTATLLNGATLSTDVPS